jgi:hypothetical protein
MLVQWFRNWILPRKDQVPDYSTLKTCIDRKEIEGCRSEFVLLHRHEDTIFNSRLQTFLLVSSFLAAGFSQFREEQYFIVQLFVCGCGVLLSLFALWILIRTARLIEWYREALHCLDAALITNRNCQPYRTRDLLIGGEQRNGNEDATVDTAEPRSSIPVSGVLGVLPLFVSLIWLAMLTWSIYNHSNRQQGMNSLPVASSVQCVKKAEGNSLSQVSPKQEIQPTLVTPSQPGVRSVSAVKNMAPKTPLEKPPK